MAISNRTLNKCQATYLTYCSVYFQQPFSEIGIKITHIFKEQGFTWAKLPVIYCPIFSLNFIF